jgi:hypothetical protein
MIDVKAENGRVLLAFPTEGMSAEQVNEFVNWLRVEAAARRSQLTADDAWRLSEDIKEDWWKKNEQRFGK